MAQHQQLQHIELTPRPASLDPDPSRSTTTLDSLGRYDAIRDLDTNPSQTNRSPDPKQYDSTLAHVVPHDVSPERPRRHYPWWQSIGLVGLLTLVAGSLVILVSCASLIFLWRGSEAAKIRQEPEFWKTIVTQGWAPRVVTICSAALRTSVTLQIGLLAAALAAIILETSGVRFSDIPVLSTERASKSSPTSILPAVLRRTAGGFSGLLHSFVISMAVIILLISTFISTILLSDFETTRIAAPAITDNSTSAFKDPVSPSFASTGASYWKSKPSAQWRFAEAQIGERRLGDTGDTYRAMIPFANETSRTSLESYSGPAIVVNTRTICTALPLDTFSIVPEPDIVKGWTDGGSVALMRDDGRLRVGTPAGCIGLGLEQLGYIRVLWTLCHCLWLPRRESRKPIGSKGQRYNFHQILMLNSTSRNLFDREGEEKNYTKIVPKRLRKLTSKSGDIWTTAYDSDGAEVFTATVCHFNTYRPQKYNVTMSGQPIRSEPTIDQEGNEEIPLQFGVGADHQEFTKRGTLKLDIGFHLRDIPDQGEIELGVLPTDLYLKGVFHELPGGSQTGWTMLKKPYTASGSELDMAAHFAHATLFQSIIQETEDPALAIQALGTRFYQMFYYDWLESYDFEARITTIHSTDVLIPARWTGLTLVLVLLGVHLSLVFTTTILFVLQTRASALGSAWQAAAQIARVTDVLESSDRMLDKEVKKWAKATGRDKEVYAASESTEGDRIEIQLRNRKGES